MKVEDLKIGMKFVVKQSSCEVKLRGMTLMVAKINTINEDYEKFPFRGSVDGLEENSVLFELTEVDFLPEESLPEVEFVEEKAAPPMPAPFIPKQGLYNPTPEPVAKEPLYPISVHKLESGVRYQARRVVSHYENIMISDGVAYSVSDDDGAMILKPLKLPIETFENFIKISELPF